MKRLIVFALGLLLATNAWAADFVWLEGENPTSSNVKVSHPSDTPPVPDAMAKDTGWSNGQYLSKEQWLMVSIPADQLEAKVPKEGVLLGYEFEAPSAGRYQMWDRIGYEYARSPFDWRLDGGDWLTIKPEDYTTDLMDLSEWTEVAWIKLGEADLAAGKHKVEIRLTATTKEENGKQVAQRILYASDALCVAKGEFRPNGRYKPGEDWQSEQDKQAAAHVFQVPAEGAGAPDRVQVPLSGIWQVCRYDEQGEVIDRDGPTTTLPDRAPAYWTSIPVPGDKFKDRPDLGFAHRIVYRTRINVPKEMAGRSFYLRFPSINLIASVFVNDQFCGWTKAMYALWECDVTKALVPGQENEVCVVVKDTYYAFSPKKSNGQSCRRSFNIPVAWIARNNVDQTFDFPVGSDYGASAGILEAPSLVAAGGVYTTDVFAMPSVKQKQLKLQFSVLNPSAAKRTVQVTNEVVPAGGGAAEKVFKPVPATIPAGMGVAGEISEPWDNAKLWWPDDPKMYDVVTKIVEGDKVLDVRHTPFGFREWQWDGPQFKLNGVPWLMHADTTYGDLGGDPEKAVAFWRKNGLNLWRFWGRTFSGLHAQEVLDFMDTHGVVVRRSGIFDGQGANYYSGLSNNKELYDNWITQLTAQVREERNHPSILIWSIENEITFINARNLGQSKAVEPEIRRGAEAVMAVDPTRPTMVDGGNCLLDNSMPVNGVHYPESYWRDYPDEAYTLEKVLAAPEKNLLPWPSPWKIMTDRPIFMGESYYLRGNKPADFALFGGEGCFSGWSTYTRRGAGLFAKMLAEGYRWHGVAAYHFWLNSPDDDGLQFNSWQPVCVLCRQWNWTFGGGTRVDRTLKVFNDTRYDTPITAGWELTLGGKRVAGEKKTLNLAPGRHEEYEVTFDVPKVSERTAGEFVLTCERGGKEVFREVKQVAVIDPNGGPRPALKKEELAVLDPSGAVKARLDARGIAYTATAAFEDIPASARVVVVGPDALTARDATDNKWLALAARGARVLALDQQNPLHYMAVPADLAPTDFVGRVAFAENIQHPIFAGLEQQDFFTWSKDHVVYRNVYRKATRGAVSLVHCDEQLGYSAVAECPVNEGLMLLCQMVVGQKLATDPVAERLFDNMLAYCAVYKPLRRDTAVAMDPATPAGKLLTDSALQYDKSPGVVEAIADGKHQVLVFDATPANLKALADNAAKVKAFADAGGWLLAWGLTPEGLADFNRLVGVEHVLRPFELERVTLPAQRDPLLSGLTGRDVAMESGVQIFGWQGDKYMVDDEFAYVVDLDDIAPFCELPGSKAGGHPNPADAAGWSRNIVNGFTSADAWKLIYYMSMDSPRIKMTLPRPETLTDIGIVLNQHYGKAGKVNLYFDDDPKPVSLTTQISTERQDFALEPRKASSLTIELAEFDKPGRTTGIDNVWLTVARTPEWHAKVKPLLNIGGLVKYPMGQGGLVLCQLNVPEREGQPENAQKKRNIVSSLLRNMGAQFSGAKILVPGEGLAYTPVALEEHCNQYLTRDRGWFDDRYDLRHLPVGANTFAGVRYLIRDFKTSPLPSCVMLSGQGVKGQMPAAVSGLPVTGKADSLFFLHAFKRTRNWQPPNQGDRTPPVLFKYVVHYADGTTADVPVRYGEGADNWMQKDPRGLKAAVVAWAAAFPDDTSGQQAVLYQMQWDNPKPDAAISSVDLTYDEGTKGQYGVPALLAVTMATRIK